ncbi:CPBP family intramembrane glutamic endopeptidase [Halioxenophilus aromaticivorans]|uniref:CAAX prenyl protease 2/Lysostaphin resistance protein A-like domain-containing protein n=1 Tax=Halioxenophilus aromaticivorans TaxID=1306992 RepID=A0AAV3U460_9ALTE
MLRLLHPNKLWRALEAIDEAKPSYTLGRQQASKRVLWVMATVCFCLLLIHYLKYASSFRALLAWASELAGHNPQYYLRKLNDAGFLSLWGYVWWSSWHLVGYVLIPVVVIRYVFKASVREMGLGWADTHRHWLGYALLLSPILLFIYLVSFRADFLQHYPFYKQASRSWFDLLAWEALYLLQFAALEFFFRGFMLNALRPAMGVNAIWVMCVPYLMIHFPKLWLEATGAILFGFFLGILALRSRSIWGGFLVHAGVAVTMDAASLISQARLPAQWLP